MRRTPPPQRSGIAGILFVFCLAGLIAGVGFDLGAGARMHFWIGDQPAAAAAVGAAAALFVAAAAQAARLLLSRKREQG